jgi:hypothetical protein
LDCPHEVEQAMAFEVAFTAQRYRALQEDLLHFEGPPDELAPDRQKGSDAPETCGAAMLVPLSSI